MKAAVVTISLILFAFPLAFSDDAQPVLDRDGSPVVTGTEYYILQLTPENPRPHGGLTHSRTGNLTCPVAVAHNNWTILGLRVRFSNPGLSPGETIFTDTQLEIEYEDQMPVCASSFKWMVFGDSSETQKAVLGIGGPLDHPGQTTLFGAFNIVPSTLGYKFVFCFLFQGSPLCSDIGTHLQSYPVSLLVLTKNEPRFQFALLKGASNSGIRTLA